MAQALTRSVLFPLTNERGPYATERRAVEDGEFANGVVRESVQSQVDLWELSVLHAWRGLREKAHGPGVTLMPVHAELTIRQAANAINVSRPYLVSLLESGAIPYRKVGTRRRVLLEHLMAYQKAEDAKRKKELNELTRQAQEIGLGY